MTYATASATHNLKKLDEECDKLFMKTPNILVRDFYKDDLISGAETLKEAQIIQPEIIKLLKLGKFHLRKWSTSYVCLLERIPIEEK